MKTGLCLGFGVLLLASATPSGAEAARYVIQIRNMAFDPPPAHLKVGDMLVWKNNDMFQHTATTLTGGFDFDLPPGAEAQTRLRKAGTMIVFCRYHPTMTIRLSIEKP